MTRLHAPEVSSSRRGPVWPAEQFVAHDQPAGLRWQPCPLDFVALATRRDVRPAPVEPAMHPSVSIRGTPGQRDRRSPRGDRPAARSAAILLATRRLRAAPAIARTSGSFSLLIAAVNAAATWTWAWPPKVLATCAHDRQCDAAATTPATGPAAGGPTANAPMSSRAEADFSRTAIFLVAPASGRGDRSPSWTAATALSTFSALSRPILVPAIACLRLSAIGSLSESARRPPRPSRGRPRTARISRTMATWNAANSASSARAPNGGPRLPEPCR